MMNCTGVRASLFSFAIAIVLFGCKDNDSQVTPSDEMEKIETAYKKIETGATPEEMNLAIKEGLDHLQKYTSAHRSLKDVSGAGYDVGVVPAAGSCPLYSELVEFVINNENNNPNSRSSGWIGSWSFTTAKDSYLYFCKADGRLFNNINSIFGVLKLGINNPSSFAEVRLLAMDNEDDVSSTRVVPNGSQTQQQANTSALPSYVDGNNLKLYFTQFKNPTGTSSFPDLGYSYGLMGYVPNALATGFYYTDDEDNNCATTESFVDGVDPHYLISFEIDRKANFDPIGTIFRLSKIKY